MSSVFNLDDDPIVIVVPSAANIPPGNITESDWLAIKDRVTVVEANGIADLSDVDLSGIENGQVLVWDVSTDTWRAGMVQSGIYRVFDWTNELTGPFSSLQAMQPLTATVHPTVPDRARIGINVGTGPNAVAVGNHSHSLPGTFRQLISPTGYMSGGTRLLASQSMTLSAAYSFHIAGTMRVQIRGADEGPAYYTMTLNIDGSPYTSPGGTSGFWAVQGVPNKEIWEFDATIAGAGSSINVTASISYHSGAGFNVDAGELKVVRTPNR